MEELGAVVAKVREGADQGRQQYAVRAGRIIWRLLMPKTRIHVYYRFEANGDVEVISVWNATGSAGPTI